MASCRAFSVKRWLKAGLLLVSLLVCVPWGWAAKDMAIVEDVPLKPEWQVLGYLVEHGYLTPDVFSEKRFYPEQPMSRALFARMLHQAAGLLTPFVSEFAYFTDVPVTHPAYAVLEGLRVRHIITSDTDGRFLPDAPITRQEAALMLSRTLSEKWLRLTPDEISMTLGIYGVHPQTLPLHLREAISRMVYAGLLMPLTSMSPDISTHMTLALDKPLSRLDGAHMIYQRALLETPEGTRQAVKIPVLPPGMTLTLSPTSAISAESLFVGGTLYFALSEPASRSTPEGPALIRGTRILGVITAVSTNRLEAEVALKQATQPFGELYTLHALLPLVFTPDKDKQAILVPGDRLVCQTLSIPE
jgi:hypothetical protein